MRNFFRTDFFGFFGLGLGSTPGSSHLYYLLITKVQRKFHLQLVTFGLKMLSWANNFIANSSKRSVILEIGNENILFR